MEYSQSREVRITCTLDEPQTFVVDKLILSFHSAFFKALFENGMKESFQTEITLEISKEHFVFFLDYLYKHKISYPKTYPEFMFMKHIIDYFQVSDLRSYIDPKIGRKLKIDYFIGTDGSNFNFDELLREEIECKVKESPWQESIIVLMVNECLKRVLDLKLFSLVPQICDHPLVNKGHEYIFNMYVRQKKHDCDLFRFFLSCGVSANKDMLHIALMGHASCKSCIELVDKYEQDLNKVKACLEKSKIKKLIKENPTLDVTKIVSQKLMNIPKERIRNFCKFLL